MKLKLNDTVKVMSGNDKGRTAKITQVNRSNETVLLDGINQYKRHLKAQGNQQAGIITLSRSLKASKVMLVCPHCNKTTRPLLSGKGKDRIRLCRHCQKPITIETKPTTKKKK